MSELRASRTPFAVATLVESRGHSPQNVGARILVTADGLHGGTIGGGKVEARAIERAQEMLANRDPRAGPAALVTWNLQSDIGMSCGGEVRIFFETHGRSAWTIAVFGAGHVAQKLVPLLLTFDARVLCIDPREEWLARLPAHACFEKIESADMPAELARIPADAFLALMTQGHAFDLPILMRALKEREPPYIGVIGSSVKGGKLRRELAEAGVSHSRIELLHCPLGLPIGSSDPAEIAVSIAAQLLAARDEYFGIRRGSLA